MLNWSLFYVLKVSPRRKYSSDLIKEIVKMQIPVALKADISLLTQQFRFFFLSLHRYSEYCHTVYLPNQFIIAIFGNIQRLRFYYLILKACNRRNLPYSIKHTENSFGFDVDRFFVLNPKNKRIFPVPFPLFE